jgi:methyl-accepting chemotaxis protein
VADTKEKGAQHDVVAWRDHNDQAPKMAQVAAAPIRDAAGTYIGSAIVGYFVTNDGGKEDAPDGLDVAYFVGDKGQTIFGGSSFDESAFLSSLTAATYTERSNASAPAMTFAEITTAGIDGMYATSIGGKEYLVMPSSFASSRADRTSQVGFLIIGSVTAAVAPIGQSQNIFLGILLLLFFVGAVVILVIVKSFMEPIEEISKGIQEVIAGKVDYMWPVEEASHLSDMSHSLNVMSFKLQGKGDPDSDDASGNAEWAGLVGGPQAPASGGKPAVVAGLGGIRGRRSSDSNTEG